MGSSSVFYDRLSQLCRDHNTTISKVTRDVLHLSPGSATQWKNGALPNSTIVIDAANYFDVSTDYLLGLSDEPCGLHRISTDNLRYLQNYLMEQLKLENPKAELLVSSMFKYILDSHIADKDNFSLNPTFEYSESMEKGKERVSTYFNKRGKEVLERSNHMPNK